MISPSIFYNHIGNMNGYNKLVKDEILPDLMKYVIKIDIKNFRNIKILELSDVNGKKIEQLICEFFNKKSIRSNKNQEIQKNIKGCNLHGFIDFLDNYKSNSNKSINNIKMCDKNIEADLLYNNFLIDIKAYINKFNQSDIIKTFIQIIIYFSYLRKDYIIKRLGIYIPTQNVFYYIDTHILDNYIDKFLSFYINYNKPIEQIPLLEDDKIITELPQIPKIRTLKSIRNEKIKKKVKSFSKGIWDFFAILSPCLLDICLRQISNNNTSINGDDVNVKGYTRNDGVYVKSHTRKKPRVKKVSGYHRKDGQYVQGYKRRKKRNT